MLICFLRVQSLQWQYVLTLLFVLHLFFAVAVLIRVFVSG